MKKTVSFLIEKGEANYKKIFAIVFFVQLFFLQLFYYTHGVATGMDSGTYITPAINLLECGKLLDGEGNPILFRTPGYSVFLAVVYLLSGYSNAVVVWLQICMVLATTWMIFSLVSELSGKKMWGCLAGIFYAADMAVYTYVVYIMTDTIFPFLLVLSLFLFYQYWNNQKMTCLTLSILSLNAALLVRPQLMYYSMILVGVVVVLALFKKIRWRECLLYCLVFIIAYGGWSFRNYRIYGEMMYTSIREEDYFAFYAPVTYAFEEGVALEDARVVFYEKLNEKYPDWGDFPTMEKLHARKDVGIGYVMSHIPAFLLVNLKGLWTEMIGPSMTEISAWGLPVLLYWMICCVFAGCLLLSYLIYAVGFLKTFRRQGWIDWLILLTVMYLMASTAILGYSRYRLAFYPLCVIGACSCWKSEENR